MDNMRENLSVIALKSLALRWNWKVGTNTIDDDKCLKLYIIYNAVLQKKHQIRKKQPAWNNASLSFDPYLKVM